MPQVVPKLTAPDEPILYKRVRHRFPDDCKVQ